jgi:hypothetical protein
MAGEGCVKEAGSSAVASALPFYFANGLSGEVARPVTFGAGGRRGRSEPVRAASQKKGREEIDDITPP